MTDLYLLSNRDLNPALSLATAVLAGDNGEVFFIDPDHPEKELEALVLLKSRMPLNPVNATGRGDLDDILKKAGIDCSSFYAGDRDLGREIIKRFGLPKGVCAAAADSPSECLRAASLAVRLGYYFIPEDSGKIGSITLTGDVPILWFGSKASLEAGVGQDKTASYRIIESYKDILNELNAAGLEADYLVLYNSADLERESSRGNSLGKLWVRGLSLLLTTLSSYRNVFPFDAFSIEPDSQVIEENLNKLVGDLNLKPKYLATLASPAAIPFFYEEKKALTAWTEEMVRDIHVKLNNDLFFDLSEGRLMQHTSGGLSTQLISTKNYREIQELGQSSGKDVLVVSTPHVESGIIFASDDSLMEAQLLPLLEEAGCSLKVLRGEEAKYSQVGSELCKADFLLYTGHGGPEGLHTHGHTLNRADLPQMAPLVAYTSACSTVAMVPHWFSGSEGLEWEGIEVDSRQVIGLSFVEKGALCFIGGATIEDLQYSTSIYAIFMEALLVKGSSVGEAVKATRNFISLYAATLLQKNPDAYRKYRWGTANAIHQQVLLGDPAFVPLAEPNDNCKLPLKTEIEPDQKIKITLSIPPDRWRRATAAVSLKESSKHYYRCRNIEVNTPFGEGVISWGDYYRVAPDADNISEKAIMSSFIHLTAELAPGQVPKRLRLVEADAGKPVCLLCGSQARPLDDPAVAAASFKLPYLLQPPIELDMREGWAFSVEIRSDHYRLHWLAPLLLLDEETRSASRLEKMVFEVESAPGFFLEGKISGKNSMGSFLVQSGFCGDKPAGEKNKEPQLHSSVMFLGEPDGSFELLAAEGSKVVIQDQFPLYDLLDHYQMFKREIIEPKPGRPVIFKPETPDMVTLNGRLADSMTGSNIAGGLIRIFRGEPDPVGDILIEAFAGETYTGQDGSFVLQLPAGKYQLYAVAAPDGLCYKSAEWPLELKSGEDFYRIFVLNQAVLVRGKVTFQDYCSPDPPAVAIKRYPKVEGEGVLSKVPVKRDGSYECLVSFQDRFRITIEEEGYSPVEDANGGKGYKLGPQQILTRDYLLTREVKEN